MAELELTTAPKRMTDEERTARWAMLREQASRSKIYAKCKDPNIACRWVRKSDGGDIATHEWMGFKVVTENMKKPGKEDRRFDTAIPPDSEGHYVLGDVILMECLQDDYDFYVADGVRKSQEAVNAGKTSFADSASDKGFPAFERDQSGRVISRDSK